MPGYVTNTRERKVSLPIELNIRGHAPIHQEQGPITEHQLTTSFRSSVSDGDYLLTNADKIYVNGFKENFSKDDTGHAFYTRKQQFLASHSHATLRSGYASFDTLVKGCLVVRDGSNVIIPGFPTVMPLSDTETSYYGHQAIAATAPTAPKANLSDFVAQSLLTPRPQAIFEDLNRIFTKTQLANQTGKEWLNLEFGWTPMVLDLKSILNTVLNSYKLVAEYEKGSGKVTRRGWRIPPERTYDIKETVFNGYLGDYVDFDVAEVFDGSPRGTLTYAQSVSTDIWFKGAYTYYLNVGPGLRGRFEKYASLAQHLLGLKMTPQVLWDLAPWTWLADWKFDLSDVLNIQSDLASDNLVIKYGYLMRTLSVRNIYTLSGVRPKIGSRGPYVNTYSVVQKERVRATPYGFGINPADFDLHQLSILAALGLTRFLRP